MHRLARLIAALDAGLAPELARTRLATHLAEVSTADAAWAVRLLGGAKLWRPALPARLLREAALRASGLPAWLFDQSLDSVGDLAETIALVLDGVEPDGAETPSPTGPITLSDWIAQGPKAHQALPDEAQIGHLAADWRRLDPDVRPLAIALCAGGRRLRQPLDLLHSAVAESAGLPTGVVAQRWAAWMRQIDQPAADAWRALTAPVAAEDVPTPEPLPTWQRLDSAEAPDTWHDPAPPDWLAGFGPVSGWRVRPHHGGLRVELLRHRGRTRLWGADQTLLDAGFPDLIAAADALPPDCALELELVAADPAAGLQARLGRARPGPTVLARTPVRVIVQDLLSLAGQDLRSLPVGPVQDLLARLFDPGPAGTTSQTWQLADDLPADDWAEVLRWHRHARARGVAGLLLRQRAAGSDDIWLLPAPALRTHALLLYAQPATGRQAGLCVDCTLAVWNRPPVDADEARAVIEAITRQEPPPEDDDRLRLVTLTRTAIGLDEAARARVDRQVRATTFVRYGPVRSVRPELVVELACDAIEPSRRHRSGVTLRAPRMLRLRPDRAPHEADDLRSLLAGWTGPASA